MSKPTSPAIEILSTHAAERASDIRWLEQRADTLQMLMTENVDIAGSQAQLSIPLLDWPLSPSLPLSLSASYSSSSDTPKNGLLGSGWSFNHPLDFIVVDRKGGIFPTAFEYILMVNSQTEQLILIPNSTSIPGISKFRLKNDAKTDTKFDILYDEPNERWTINSKNILAVFGRSPNRTLVQDAVQETLHWDNWRGFGYSEKNLDSLQKEAQAWYLISREEKHGLKTKLLYDYHMEEASLPNGKRYTNLVELKCIRTKNLDTENGLRLDLHYGEKNTNEYHVQSPINSHGHYHFPLFLQSKLFLEGFTLQAGINLRQEIRLEYETKGNMRLLTGINQFYNEGYTESLFKFVYEEYEEGTAKRHLMSQARLGVGEQNVIKYFYKQLQIPLLDFGPKINTKEYLTTKNMQLKIGENYSVIAHHVGTTVITVEILNRELTASIASLEVDVHMNGGSSGETIEEYEVILYSHLLGVFVSSKMEGENKEGRQYVALFHWNGEWSEIAVFFGSYNKGDLFRFSDKIMLLARQTGVLEIYEPDNDSDKGFKSYAVSVSSHSIRRCVIQDSTILAFDGHSLFTVTQNKESNTWIKNSNFAEVTSKEIEFEADVYLNEQVSNAIKQQITKYGLQMYKNMVLLSELGWENDIFSCKANLYLLDRSYDLHRAGKFISGGDLSNQSIHDFYKDVEEEGEISSFGYKLVDSKYRFQLVALSGKTVNEFMDNCIKKYGRAPTFLCPDSQLKPFKEAIKEKITNTNKEFDYIFRDVMLFDPSPCLKYKLDSSGVVTNSSIIHMQGDSWAQEWVKNPLTITNVALHSAFVLESTQQKNSTDFRLFTQDPENGGKIGGPIETFSISLNGTIAIGYPSYIAYQTSELDPIVIIPIVGNGTGENIELRGQKLLGMSTAHTLLTYKIFDDPNLYPKNLRVFARRINSLISSQPFNVLERCEVSAENEEVVRITKYENEFFSNRTSRQQENTIRVIPTGSPSYSGTYEEVTIIPLDIPTNATLTQKWLDTEGALVRSMVIQSSNSVGATKPADEFHTLLDSSGNLKIADIFPYNLTQNLVAYYGFEKYENSSTFGTNFKFDAENVVDKSGGSLTGTSLLRLGQGEKLSLSLSPSEQSFSYTASCWIRLTKSTGDVNFEYDFPVRYFRANLGFASLELDKITPFLTLYGQMKRQIDNWHYLEVTADLDKIRSNVYTEYYKQSKEEDNVIALPSPDFSNFTISIEVESSEGIQVDVDHIKFSPTGSDIRVKIYNMKGQETETILGNGAITRKIYHEVSGDEIAEIDEEGEVRLFRSGTKSGSLFPGDSNSTIGTGMKSELFLIPNQGSFERFNLFQFETGRWETNKLSNWEMKGVGKISHLGVSQITELKVGNPKAMFGKDALSSALRFYFQFSSDINLESLQIILGNNRHLLLEIKSLGSASFCNMFLYRNSTVKQVVPCHGQIVLLIENQTMWLWFDGFLLYEGGLSAGLQNPWSNFIINARGKLSLSNMFILNKPQVMLTYFNAFGQRTQMLKLESENEIHITELLYDEMGRESIHTKTGRLRRQGSEPILKYYKNLISNRSPFHHNSVFRTGFVQGLLAEMYPEDNGYSFGRTFYMNDLTGEVAIKGYPGKDFLQGGRFVKEYVRESNIIFLHDLFPPHEGFTQKVLKEPNSNIQITIFDSKGREVGDYTQVPGYSHILTTYEYDKEGNLLKILPPNYHQQVHSFSRKIPISKGEKSVSETKLAKKLGTHFTYNTANQMTSKKSPDIDGRQEYLYDMLDNLRFFYTAETKGESKLARDIIYFLHSGSSKPVEVGYIEGKLPVEKLIQFQNSTEVPNSEKHVYQRIVHSDSHSDPRLRGRVKLFMTYNGGELEEFTSDNGPPHQELLKFDSKRNLVLKTTNTATSRAAKSEVLTSLHKHYKAGKMTELQYPREAEVGNATGTSPLTLILSYDKSGHLTALGTRNNPTQYASFTYSATGSLLSESLEPGSQFAMTRHFEYNTPGLLIKISDPFLTQKISFTESGYGQIGYGDGIVMSSQFEASWAKTASMYDSKLYRQWFSVPVKDYANQEIMSMCLKALTRQGFLDKFYSIPQKFLGHAELSLLPLACGGSMGHKLMKLLGEKLPPIKEYGQSYSYGNYKDLTKSKFFTGNGNGTSPLQANTFHKELPTIVENSSMSERIWDALASAGFIIVDNPRPEDKAAAVGMEGNNKIFRYNQLQTDLEAISLLATTYTRPIIHLLFETISKNQPMLSLTTFQNTFVGWLGYTDKPLTATVVINKAKQDAQKIYAMLMQKGYISRDMNVILVESFIGALPAFRSHLPEIAGVLHRHFISQLGLSINDYEAVAIDDNGNHKSFFVGFNRHTLEYSENSNKISRLKVQDPFAPINEDLTIFEFQHNSQGNICKAQHRNIDLIRYHPVTNRPVYMLLSDGRKLIFQYDAQGERLLKRVYDSNGILLSEVTYLRDETGRVIRDIRKKFGDSPMSITTTYIYGPRGLLGFIRGSKFFSVFSDHAGSIRLVTQGGKVQAAYDYWPYGSSMREVGEVDSHIYYRYTGQEYDEETGLYNYHARLYDPLLGRFYQPDPKSQYPSPYIYAGNSPLSMVDPDGELAGIIAVIVLAVIGAYLAAAAVNDSWDFTKWDWTDFKTYLALAGGAVAGAAMPGSFAAAASSVGAWTAVGVGLVGSFVSAGEEFGWNPLSWDWTSPSLYNSFFNGFGSGVKAAKDPSNVVFIEEFKKLGGLLKNGQLDLFFQKLVNGVGNAYLGGVAANGTPNFLNWDYTNLEMWAAFRDGFVSGTSAPIGYLKYFRNFLKAIQASRGNSEVGYENTGVEIAIENSEILQHKDHPLFSAVGESLIGQLSENKGRVQIGNTIKYDKLAMSTFEGFLNDVMEEPQFLTMVNKFRTANHNFPKEKYFERLSFQEQISSKLVHQFDRGILQLSNFYFETSVPDPDYESEVKILLQGLHAGRNIYVESGLLKNFVDCVSTSSAHNLEIEKCDIFTDFGRKKLQNREWIHQLFQPSKKYESTKGFLQIENPAQVSDEFLENLFLILKNIPGNTVPSFLYDLFIGASYHSLLSPNHDILIRREVLVQGLEVLHLAVLKNDVLFIRTVSIGSREIFANSKFLVNYLKTQKFKCQIDSVADRKRIKIIQGELTFIQVNQNITDKLEIFTHTPKLGSGCKVGSSPNFFKKMPREPPADGENVFQDFEAFNLITNDGQRLFETFEQFIDGSMSIFKLMKSNLGEEVHYSFTGFMLGFIIANFKRTFDIQFVIQSHYKVVFVARNNGYGVKNWKATPIIINLNLEDYIDFNSPNETYPLSGYSLADEALGADVHYATDLISYSIRALPKFEGFCGQNWKKTVRESLQYLFYSMSQRESRNKNREKSLENKHFVSNSILGELIAQATADSKIFVFTGITKKDQKRFKAQRLFLVVDEKTTNATIYNVIESSKVAANGKDFEFNPDIASDIPSLPSGVQISYLMEIKINLNTNSQSCYQYKNIYSVDGSCFFQSLENKVVENISEIPVESAYLEIAGVETNQKAFLNFGQKHVKKLFKKLAGNEFKPFLQTDIDMSSIVSAYLFEVDRAQNADTDGLQLRVRQRVSPALFPVEHSLLSITEMGEVVPDSEQVLLQNIIPNPDENASKSLQEAEEELKLYYCSQPERFSEFLRVTDVPAVYGPRLKFEVEPDFLYQPSCFSNTSNSYSVPKSKSFDSNPASSSASSQRFPGFSPMGLLNHLKYTFSKFIFGKPKASSKTTHFETSQTCQQGAWQDGSYNMDGLTCYLSGAKVLVFPAVKPTDLLSSQKGNFPPHITPLVGETYSKSTCDSIEFNGAPSVTCRGQRSTFIYTPYHQERVFDNVDSNIMLGRVLLHLGAKLIGQSNSEKLPDVPSTINQEHITKWRRIIAKIEDMVIDLKDDGIEWAHPLVEDCKDMLVEMECQLAKIKQLETSCKIYFDVEQFEERLYALHDDLEEQKQNSSSADDNQKFNYGFDNDRGKNCRVGQNLYEFIARNVVFQNENVFSAYNNAVN